MGKRIIKKYENVDDLNLTVETSFYICGSKSTSINCISTKARDECSYGWYDEETQTIRCCCYDYLKIKN